MGVDVRREGPAVSVHGIERLSPIDIDVPGDFSSAAFWMVAAAAHPDADVVLTGVGVNQTRTGLLDVLREMGAEVDVLDERSIGEEPVADLRVRSAPLRGIEVAGETAVRMMDELPVFAVAAAAARGPTVVRDAEELRVKESDRIAAIATQMRALGVEIEERPDGFVIEGGKAMRGTPVEAGGDHRMAMALAVAGLLADGATTIKDGDAVDISYPAFWHDLQKIVDPGTGS
jgi:3-phosphoshikimate 1-carboxyvinyltransferase